MTTRKHKPAPAAAAKKRSSAHASKPVKTVAAEKTVAVASVARDKDKSKAAAAPKKTAASEVSHVHVKPVEIKAAEPAPVPESAKSAPPPDGKNGGAKSAAVIDKKPLGIERRVPVMPEDRQSQLKLLIARGKEQGYLTYSQVNDHLPSEIVDPEQIEDIVNTINDMGIPVYEKAPDTESLLQNEPSAPADEEAIEEAAAALAALD